MKRFIEIFDIRIVDDSLYNTFINNPPQTLWRVAIVQSEKIGFDRSMNRREEREQAFLFIFESKFHNNSLSEITELAHFNRNIEISSFACKVFEGVKKEQKRIHSLIETKSTHWDRDRLSRVTSAILELCLYEMLYEKDIPMNVSINEAVELAKKYGTPEDASFINGVLGGVAREMESKDE